MDVPEVAIRWLAKNTCSNVELATFSNVNRHWRNAVVQEIVQQILVVETGNGDDDGDNRPATENSNSISRQGLDYSPMSTLLLPSMARSLKHKSLKTGLSSNEYSLHAVDTFCLAWFHPMGIQIRSVPIGEPTSSEDELTPEGESTEGFAPSGGNSLYEGSDDDGGAKKKWHPRRNRKEKAASSDRRRQTCSHEWRGYRQPMEVLIPFGYANDFVNCVLNCISEGKKVDSNIPPSSGEAKITNAGDSDYCTSFAVRGAALARPDGYCMCWDNDMPVPTEVQQIAYPHGRDAESVRARGGVEREDARRQEHRRARIIRNKRRRELQQLALPRMLLSTKEKRPDLRLPPPLSTTGTTPGKRQRCLQFLNAPGTHAVRLMTPQFDCGPVEGPITVFCVGIATEDGCFFSGLKRRFEMGHMHPIDPRDALIDMSPACLVIDHADDENNSTSPSSRLESYSNENSLDSDDSSCYSDLKNSAHESKGSCDCPFQSAGMRPHMSNYVDDDDVEEPREENIYRGQTGPGLWHCYVAVFDGENSVLRIDGIQESLQRGSPYEDSDTSNHGRTTGPASAFSLDGITIGSDHSFDMSLCYGDGVDGEGEGAISELAFFKGRLLPTDIESIEKHLMEKHGIPNHRNSSIPPVQEDEWKRQAHALIVQPPPWKLTGDPVPLRVAAKHKSVAWHRTNTVTGKNVRVSRIGSKLSTGSSDW